MIMTSNIGARQLADFGTGVGFSTDAKKKNLKDDQKAVIEKALKKAFAPEFINRVDDLILFNSLDKDDIHKIIDIELAKLYSRINDLGYNLKLTNAAKDYITEKGYDAKFGARPLKRAIQKYIEDTLAEEIINSSVEEGDSITVDYDKKNEKITVKVKKGSKTASESTNEDEE